MTCPRCNGAGAYERRQAACACLLCFGTGSHPEPASADVVIRRLHVRAHASADAAHAHTAILCLRAAVALGGVTGQPAHRVESLALHAYALALCYGAGEDCQRVLADCSPYLDGRARSKLVAMTLRCSALGRSGAPIRVEEVIRA